MNYQFGMGIIPLASLALFMAEPVVLLLQLS